jgi:3-dehydroquinate synthetase
MEDHRQALAELDPAALVEAVGISCQIKANIVEVDEKEGGVRAILNFGHTLGHAVELLAGYGVVRHGEAVAMGMVAAAAISESMGLCEAHHRQRIEDLLSSFQLPVRLPYFDPSAYLDALGRDKKIKSGVLSLVLNRGIGDCVLQTVNQADRIIVPVLEKFMEKAQA